MEAALVLTGCSRETRDKWLPVFFDMPGSSEATSRPPTRRVRRDLLREIDDLKQALAEAQAAPKGAPTASPREIPVERAKTWDEAREALPKDASGAVDWAQALKDRTIAPRPGPDPETPPQAVLDLDVELQSAGSRFFRAAFGHGSHTQWLACGNCHPAIFPLGSLGAVLGSLGTGAESRPTRPAGGPDAASGGHPAAPSGAGPPVASSSGRPVVTMAAIAKGEYCGACHGSVAFGSEGECVRCHRTIPATSSWRPGPPAKPIEAARTWAEAMKLLPVKDDAPDWDKALGDGVIAPRPGIDPKAKEEDVLDLDVVRADGMPHKVVFPHAAHTAWVACDSCHPAPYRQEAGATPMSMDKIADGQLCGSCHGKVAFPVESCGRCHPGMSG